MDKIHILHSNLTHAAETPTHTHTHTLPCPAFPVHCVTVRPASGDQSSDSIVFIYLSTNTAYKPIQGQKLQPGRTGPHTDIVYPHTDIVYPHCTNICSRQYITAHRKRSSQHMLLPQSVYHSQANTVTGLLVGYTGYVYYI